METFDFIRWVGRHTCNGSADFLFAYEKCTRAEAWNFGFIVVLCVATVLLVRDAYVRRNRRRRGLTWHVTWFEWLCGD
jgi:hypothetical protein